MIKTTKLFDGAKAETFTMRGKKANNELDPGESKANSYEFNGENFQHEADLFKNKADGSNDSFEVTVDNI